MGFNIKPMTIEEMTLALDRISRFKFPEDKLKRVYVETICSHIYPSAVKKAEIEKYEYKLLLQKFEEIWNFSIKFNFKTIDEKDFSLNENYIKEEKKCYCLKRELMDLMPKTADFKTLVRNIKNIPNNFENYKTQRKIVLTEGITEEILLPEFSKIYGKDWDKYNIKIVGTGGKNKLLTHYKTYKEQLKIPIYVLMDFDAMNIYEQITKELRKIDKAHIIKIGEIEDIIPKTLFKKAINAEFKIQSKISIKDFDEKMTMVENLHNIYKINGFGEFKKSQMANLVKKVLDKNTKLSSELEQILNEIITL